MDMVSLHVLRRIAARFARALPLISGRFNRRELPALDAPAVRVVEPDAEGYSGDLTLL
jgi:hypothetical protein